MDNSQYKDPINKDEILTKIKNASNLGSLYEIINEIYPNLFVTIMKAYSDDYMYLNTNWKLVCDKIGVSPKEILILDNFNYDSDHTLIRSLCEILTTSGFSVRRKCEYIPCGNCQKALPTKMLWDLFKEKNMNIPQSWSLKCTKC